MMNVERRASEPRLSVHRPVELTDALTGETTTGFTRNLSTGGMLARFERPPVRGETVSLAVTLEDGRDPVNRLGRVVWRANDLYGAGGDVGLRFVEPGEPEEERPETTAEALLVPGRRVQLSCGVHALAAVVESAVPDRQDDRSAMLVILRLTGADAPAPVAEIEAQGEGELLPGEEDFRARPIHDLVERVKTYAGPVAVVLARLVILTSRWLSPRLGRLWARLPEGTRAPVERFVARLELPRRARLLEERTRAAGQALRRFGAALSRPT